jgi:negative regulator of sigma E activity
MTEHDARALVDALMDREVPIDELASCEESIAQDRVASETLDSYRAMFDGLRRPVDTPDMAESILREVGRRRRWMAPSWQRIVTTGRLAMAASLLAACAVVLLVQRTNPDATVFADRATPLSDVVHTSQTEANAGLVSVGSVIPTMASFDAPEMPIRRFGTERWFRLDQATPVYQIQIGQNSRVLTIDASSSENRVMRFEFRSGSCEWTVGKDHAEDARDRWSVLSVNNN